MTKQQIKELHETSVKLANVCAYMVDHGRIELGTVQSNSLIVAWRKLQAIVNEVQS